MEFFLLNFIFLSQFDAECQDGSVNVELICLLEKKAANETYTLICKL